MQKFVRAIGLFALVLIVQELLVPVEASRVRVVKVKKTRHDKRQAQPTSYDYQDDRYNEDLGASGPSGSRPQDQYAVANRRSGRTLDDNRLAEFNKKVKRADGDAKDDDGHCDGPCGDGIPGTAGNDYPTFASPPKTTFDCKAQKFPGYYADVEAKCQSFWICQPKRADIFLCPNGTVFNQQVMVCDWWFNVDCATSADFYSRNQYLYAGPGIDITGAQIPVYKGDKNGAAAAPRETRATAQSKLQRPEQSVGVTGADGNNYNRRAVDPRDNYEEIQHDESINYAQATNDRRSQRQQEPQYIQKNYKKRDQLGYSTQTTGNNRQTTTLRQSADDYTTQPSTGSYSTGGATGNTGGYQTDRSVTSPAATNSKLSKNPHPFLTQGTYPAQSQTQRQTTPAAVTARREYSGQSQRATPIQSPNSIPYQKAEYNKQQRAIYAEKPVQNQEQQYFRGQQQQQRSQRYNYDSEQTTRPQTTTKRNAIDADFSKEYSDTEDGFNFHFAKIPVQPPTPTELPAGVAEKYDLGVAATTYRPSAAVTITSSPKILTGSLDENTPIRHNIQHPKYDEDEDAYTTSAPVFGKKVKSGRKRNTADWTNYFRSKN